MSKLPKIGLLIPISMPTIQTMRNVDSSFHAFDLPLWSMFQFRKEFHSQISGFHSIFRKTLHFVHWTLNIEHFNFHLIISIVQINIGIIGIALCVISWKLTFVGSDLQSSIIMRKILRNCQFSSISFHSFVIHFLIGSFFYSFRLSKTGWFHCARCRIEAKKSNVMTIERSKSYAVCIFCSM